MESEPLQADARRSGRSAASSRCPETLGEAIDELAGSDLVRRAFGDHIFDNYVKLKRQEWDEYRVQLTPWELEKYLPVLVAGRRRGVRWTAVSPLLREAGD